MVSPITFIGMEPNIISPSSSESVDCKRIHQPQPNKNQTWARAKARARVKAKRLGLGLGLGLELHSNTVTINNGIKDTLGQAILSFIKEVVLLQSSTCMSNMGQ